MGYVSHIFMYMDIRKHINLVKNHGYEGKIGMIKKDVHGIVMLAAKAGDIVLYRPYKEDENDYEENTTKYCSIETPLSEERIQENRRNGCGLKTIGVCVNVLLLNCMFASGQLKEGEMYDVDFDHQFIETEKYDAKPTYKKFLGYRPGVAVIDDLIVGIENSDGNTNVRFHQKDTLKRFFERFEQNGLTINRFRADCGSCSEEIVEEIEKHSKSFYIRANRCSSLYNDIFALRGWKTEEINGIEFELNSILVEKWKGKAYRLVIQRQKRMDGVLDLWEGEYTYRCILTNDYESSTREIVEFYNLRGGKERIFDDMNNGFGWDRLPKSFMAENTVFLLLTALIRNFYKAIIHRLDVKRFGLNATSRIKAFVFRFVSVPAKWIRTSRRYVLNIYTCNNAYADIFQTDFG